MDKKEVKPKKTAVVKPAAHKPVAAHSAKGGSSSGGKAPVHHVVRMDHATPHVAASGKTRYYEGIGRRKTAIARVRVSKGAGKIVVNDIPFEKYFQTDKLRKIAEEAMGRLNLNDVSVSVKIQGGGINAQAEAVRHGISRALVMMNPDSKTQLATLGYLTRDSRMVERKKYGLRKARRAPQWKKR